MRADIIRTSPRGSSYAPHEDTVICRMFNGQREIEAIAAVLDRTPKSVAQRIYNLRRSGVIGGYTPRRFAVEVDTRPFSMTAPLTLRNDDKLVATVRRLGGFPRAVITSVGTIWAAADGRPWSYGRPVESEA